LAPSSGLNCSKRLPAETAGAEPLVIVLIGPGGAGKGSVAGRLTSAVPGLWLSRSWTTRARRPGEATDAYTFVTDEAFGARVAEDGFLEWAEFLGNRYGTPTLDPPPGHDVLLEIDVAGARQVLDRIPDAVVVLLLPPSEEVQRRRLLGRGDDEAHVAQRLAKAEEETTIGRVLAGSNVVVNDDLDRAVTQVGAIVQARRAERRRPARPPGGGEDPEEP
jgi:guanylate kinase